MDETLDSYYLFGLETLQGRLPALVGEAAGVTRTAEDIEYVHRMRVASRRMRNALALFGDDLPRKHYAAWRGEMRRITRALSAARDADVQIAWVQDYLKQDTDEAQRVGIERLLLRLRQQRARLQGRVVKALDRLEGKRIFEDMNETLQQLLVHARVYEIESLPADLYRRANEAIRLRLEEFLAYEPHVAHPEPAAELHQMRILAPHLARLGGEEVAVGTAHHDAAHPRQARSPPRTAVLDVRRRIGGRAAPFGQRSVSRL